MLITNCNPLVGVVNTDNAVFIINNVALYLFILYIIITYLMKFRKNKLPIIYIAFIYIGNLNKV